MITVITPYKNAVEYLGRCCESLHRQEGDFEFLIIDDNATEEERQIVREYEEKDSRFKLLYNEHKPGVSGARNTGLDLASGEWITFLDADDTMNDRAWWLFMGAVRVSNHVQIYQFNHYRYYPKKDRLVQKYSNRAGVFDVENLPRAWCYVWNKLYKADLLKEIRFDETMRFAEDEMFNLECFAVDGRIICNTGVTMTHRFDNEKSLARTKGEKEIFKLAQSLTNYIKKHPDPKLRRMACLRLSEHWSKLFLKVLGG